MRHMSRLRHIPKGDKKKEKSMSHVSEIELKIKSLEALKAACARLGLELIEGQQTFRSYYGLNKCSHAIRIPGASYEVGLVEKDGELTLSWDDWGSGGLKAKLGEKAGRLKQAYTIEQTKAVAKRSGYQVREKRTMMDRLRGAIGMKQVEGVRLTLRRY